MKVVIETVTAILEFRIKRSLWVKRIFKIAIHSIQKFLRFLLRSILRSIFLSCDRLRAFHLKNLRFVAPLMQNGSKFKNGLKEAVFEGFTKF